MLNFSDKQRVRITNPAHSLAGKTGTVWRLRHCDDMAWVNMDEDLPDELAKFPENDSRHRHICLAPEDCEEVK